MQDFDLTSLFRTSVGFDNMMHIIDSAMNVDNSSISYPPYNIEKLNENTYRITMAVAGFSEADLNVIVQNNILIVSGRIKSKNEDVEYLYRGIAGRAFEHHFNLADFIKVGKTTLENGLLRINLIREIPEAMKPKKIKIHSKSSDSKLIEHK